jgi:hypothetical protein
MADQAREMVPAQGTMASECVIHDVSQKPNVPSENKSPTSSSVCSITPILYKIEVQHLMRPGTCTQYHQQQQHLGRVSMQLTGCCETACNTGLHTSRVPLTCNASE